MTALPKNWREIKAKIIARYGSVTVAAQEAMGLNVPTTRGITFT